MTRLPDQIVALDPFASYEADEVALIVFHVTTRTFRRHRRKLRAEGFPQPVSQWGKRVWSGQALIDWQNRDRIAATSGPSVVMLQQTLAARARQAARKGTKASARSR